jgi:hypothetical protein
MKRASIRKYGIGFVVLFALLIWGYRAVSEKISVSKIEIHLSAFGVEADDFPSIEGYIDFTTHTSHCTRSYYNPAYHDSFYQLSKEEIEKVLELLQHTDLDKIKKEFTTNKPDQPTSTLVIYTSQGVYTIKDYGLQGDQPLPDLYKIIYKF